MPVSDTDRAAERVQIDLLRAASFERRATLARSLSTTTLELARRAIEEAHPDASEDELGVRFVAACYGKALAERLRRYIEACIAGRQP
ncbi:MAG: hypothetical protein HYX52_04975 [Chloroflexi bacterium]|nr:hypothetical protein [Chloroflexota bacterium]